DQEEALSFADQVALLRGGRLHQVGTPRELYLRPIDASTASFFGEAILLEAELGDGQAKTCLGPLGIGEGSRRGRATIMLRPEQVTLGRVDAGESPENQVVATIESVTFGGALSAVILRLVDKGVDDTRLSLKYAGPEKLRAGDVVAIAVHGTPHLLPAH